MVIGGFAATLYGITRATYDIDIVVDLKEQHIIALVAAYPAPRYYAGPTPSRCAARSAWASRCSTSSMANAARKPISARSRGTLRYFGGPLAVACARE